MTDFIPTLLVAYGICFGLMNDKASWLTAPLRRIPLFPDDLGQGLFDRLLACPYCTGFHAGYIAWAIVHAHALATTPSWWMLIEALASAFASSAGCYLLDITAEWLENRVSAE